MFRLRILRQIVFVCTLLCLCTLPRFGNAIERSCFSNPRACLERCLERATSAQGSVQFDEMIRVAQRARESLSRVQSNALWKPSQKSLAEHARDSFLARTCELYQDDLRILQSKLLALSNIIVLKNPLSETRELLTAAFSNDSGSKFVKLLCKGSNKIPQELCKSQEAKITTFRGESLLRPIFGESNLSKYLEGSLRRQCFADAASEICHRYSRSPFGFRNALVNQSVKRLIECPRANEEQDPNQVFIFDPSGARLLSEEIGTPRTLVPDALFNFGVARVESDSRAFAGELRTQVVSNFSSVPMLAEPCKLPSSREEFGLRMKDLLYTHLQFENLHYFDRANGFFENLATPVVSHSKVPGIALRFAVPGYVRGELRDKRLGWLHIHMNESTQIRGQFDESFDLDSFSSYQYDSAQILATSQAVEEQATDSLTPVFPSTNSWLIYLGELETDEAVFDQLFKRR